MLSSRITLRYTAPRLDNDMHLQHYLRVDPGPASQLCRGKVPIPHATEAFVVRVAGRPILHLDMAFLCSKSTYMTHELLSCSSEDSVLLVSGHQHGEDLIGS